MMKLINNLWFKTRDIVSDGFDESLKYISNIIPLEIHKIASGTKCWTWTVPEKWNVKQAYIEDLDGNRILDLKEHPLHIVSYSLAIDKIVSKGELLQHLHTNPERPDAIPFEFKYYEKDWGFCIQHNRLKDFTKERYKVFIDSKFDKGDLKVGDYTIKGKTDKTIVLVAHLCHPAQVNDDLTGVAVMIDIAKKLSSKKNYYTYKFLFVPETIGSIAYLSQNEDLIPKLKYGIFLEMLGNDNIHALQLTKQGNTRLDRIAKYVMKRKLSNFRTAGFKKVTGNDEMVFNGPGVNIPMISISRFPYPEYHTSDDNPDIISEQRLKQSKNLILEILNIIDNDYMPKRQFKGPVFLSGYGLWVDWRINEKLNRNIEQIMLNLEGDKTIFDIAEELDMEFNDVLDFTNKLKVAKLLNGTCDVPRDVARPKDKWEDLHSKERFQVKYPSEHVVRFVFTQFPQEIDKRSQIKILDLGCGAGSNTVLLAKEGFQVYATDISENGLRVTEKRLKENGLKAEIKNVDMENQPFPDNFFDGVISYGVFYYNNSEGYQKAVSEMHRILKKGGKAFVFTRTTDDYRFGRGKEVEKNTFILDIEDTNEKDMIMHFLDKEEINTIFNKFGKVVIEKTETTFSNLEKKNSDWIIKVEK